MSETGRQHASSAAPPCPERVAYLEEMTRFALSALDQAAALSDFTMSLGKLDEPSAILRLCLERVGGLLPFSAMGVWLVDEEDSSFHPALCSPADGADGLRAYVDQCIENGSFAFALREKRAALSAKRKGKPRYLLHVLTTPSRTRGMFVARLADPALGLSEVSLSILSIILNNTAGALESFALYRRIQGMNTQLEDKLTRLARSEQQLTAHKANLDARIAEKTSELSDALLRLEQEVVQRKRAEALLEALNQRLEAKVEVRTQALFRKVAEMEAANKQLKQLERLKSSFLSSVSHELRTPLTSILGFAKLITKDFAKYFHPLSTSVHIAKAERLLRNLDIVEKESERLTRLINDVLDLTRIESGKMLWRDEPLNLAEAAADAVMAVEGRLEARPGLELRMDMPPGLPLVLVDRDRILQVLINLLDNALKFTDQGTVLIGARLDGDGLVQVRVEDTGPGISEVEAEKIFDKFHQHSSHDTLKDKPKGTGLGLAICRHIVGHYAGRIWVESPGGQGSTFYFTLPALA